MRNGIVAACALAGAILAWIEGTYIPYFAPVRVYAYLGAAILSAGTGIMAIRAIRGHIKRH